MAKDKTVEKKRKFSLIDLLMIIMVVGIALTLIIPLRNDTLTKNRLSEAIRNTQIIANADNAFKDDPANGYYIFEHTVCKLDEGDGNTGEDLLNVKGNLWRTFQETIVAPENAADYEKGIWMFDYSVTDSTVVATTNKNFGKEGASIFYFLPTGPWGVSDDKTSESIIDPNWLP